MSRDRVIVLFPVGNSGDDAKSRYVGWDGVLRPTTNSLRPPNGYQAFSRQLIARAVEQCRATRVQLHNPFGVGPNREMQAGQYLDARAAKLDWLTREFVPAVSRWTPTTEIIAYCGGFAEDPRFMEAAAASGPGLERLARDAYDPVISAGCSIGFDALHDMNEFSARDRRLVALANSIADAARQRDLASRRYCETYPHKRDAWWVNRPDAQWGAMVPSENAIVSTNSRERDAALQTWALDGFEGEVIVILNSLKGLPASATWANFPSWIVDWVGTQMSRNYSVAVGASSLFDHNLTVEDLLP